VVALPENRIRDRVEGLFDRRHKMLGTDFYEALRARGLARAFSRTLRDVLVAGDSENGQLFPWLENVELRGPRGIDNLDTLLRSRRFLLDLGGRELRLPVVQLSDGYQSLAAWITDLLGHAFLDADGPVAPADLAGIVLVDEIDLHLHPTWQRRLVPLLRQVFPNVQFVFTTHSPLILGGFEQNEVVPLRLDAGHVTVGPAPLQPAMLTASQSLATFFDVARAGRPGLVEQEREYLQLVGRRPQLGEPDRRRLEELERTLRPYWGEDPHP